MPEAASESTSVLIVEDEQALADLYAEWLADAYTVSTAYTGDAALEQIDDSIDIVLLDRRLPGLAGDEILEWINDHHPDIQVAIVSAVTPDFGMLGLGIEDYLLKPVKRDDLLGLVDEMRQRTTYDNPRHQLARLQSTKASLEAEKNDAELTTNDKYQELVAEIDRLQTNLNTNPQ